jgi:hypothetical protein
MKQTAVDYLIQELFTVHDENFDFNPVFEQAKEMEKKQIFKALNQSAKEAYIAGQQTMSCGCYEIRDALTYEEWLYETFKTE